MKITTITAALLLAGCTTLTPTQKKVIIGAGTVLAIGAIAASSHRSSGSPADPRVATPADPCKANPTSCR